MSASATELPRGAVADAPVDTPVRHRSSALLSAGGLARVEFVVAAMGTLFAIYLHSFFARNVGALWRDEANSVSLATLPSFSQTWENLQFDSFPILFLALLRGWTSIFGAANDPALRVLGLSIGLGIVGALWLNARAFGARWPLASLALLGLNPLFVRYVDSMRAQGLGILLILLTLWAVWRMLESLRPARVALAAGLAILSVHANYYNTVLLLAIGVGAAFASARERRWRLAICSLGIGVPAAISLLAYVETIRRVGSWNFLVKGGISLPWLWIKLSEVTGAPESIGIWIWVALLVGGLGIGLASVWGSKDRATIFAAATLVVSTVAYTAFLFVLKYSTEPWYYVAYLAMAGACVDVIFGRLLSAPRAVPFRAAWLLGFGLLFAFDFAPARADLFQRQTNVDLVADRLNRFAKAGDVIVLDHWESAITLVRYYRGPAAVLTLPPLSEHRYHRYDELLAQMMLPDPAAPVLAQIEEALRGGHHVWFAGPIAFPPPGRTVIVPPPLRFENGVPNIGGAYYGAWAMQAGKLLQDHAVESVAINVSDNQPVVRYERVPLTGVAGWH